LQETIERIDYLTFGQGAVPVRVSGLGATLGVTIEKAVLAADGDPDPFTISLKMMPEDADTEFVYRLPAMTTFDRFSVPNVLETPSRFQTFTRAVEIYGSQSSADDGFILLGSGRLATHPTEGQLTELITRSMTPVRFVKVRLIGGIQLDNPEMFFEFSEIIGHGTQDVVPLAQHFTGAWQGRGVSVRLRQSGAAVTGCYDLGGSLKGTVTGGLLRATGVDGRTGVESLFLLSVIEDGVLLGMRSTNGAPFRVYTGGTAAVSTARCPEPPPPALGCGAVIHGISFGFDSADILPASEPVLAMLYDGLRNDKSASILIEGHTSSEGTDTYNRGLSLRRAGAVVSDLVKRGIAAARLSASGAGESSPMASNADETGRAMNRRVEVRCK
jgi:hypothetical protein